LSSKKIKQKKILEMIGAQKLETIRREIKGRFSAKDKIIDNSREFNGTEIIRVEQSKNSKELNEVKTEPKT
jgi:hypothetical protein